MKTKAATKSKKPQVKIRDIKPSKDAKGAANFNVANTKFTLGA
jgi:hypothetical protein